MKTWCVDELDNVRVHVEIDPCCEIKLGWLYANEMDPALGAMV